MRRFIKDQLICSLSNKVHDEQLLHLLPLVDNSHLFLPSASSESSDCDILALLKLSHGPFDKPLSYIDNNYIKPVGTFKECVFSSVE